MPYVYVCCYTRFGNLAHAPQGCPAEEGIQIFHSDPDTGKMTWVGSDKNCDNPGFARFHPKENVFYTCSESIMEDDRLYLYTLGESGKLKLVKEEALGGKSACFLTIDRLANHLLYVNYWDSTIGSLPLSDGGNTGSIKNLLRAEKKVVARHRGDHLVNRQSESHAHAIVLDPSGKMAFVPDLGKDIVHQFLYDEVEGQLKPAGRVSAAFESNKGPHGPRYLDFHPKIPYAYLVNELSSTISVFHLNSEHIENSRPGDMQPALELEQMVSTLPPKTEADGNKPAVKNTCGRISVHESGSFLLCSNRGHDSLAVYRIMGCGHLKFLHCVSTGGRTPRHFKFAPGGKFCYVANQDTNNVSVFSFNEFSGKMAKVDDYLVKSPNFIAITGERPHSQLHNIKYETSYTKKFVKHNHGLDAMRIPTRL